MVLGLLSKEIEMAQPIDVEELRKKYIYLPYGALAINGYKPKRVGSVLRVGYEYVFFQGRNITTQRLVWAYHFGDPGDMDVDHIDQNRLNNRIENLRLVTRSENMQNTTAAQSNSSSGIKGIFYDRSRRKWAASLNVGGAKVFFQRFNTKQEAMEARAEAVRKYHPFAPTDS